MGGAPGYSTEVLSGDTGNQGVSLSQDKVTSLLLTELGLTAFLGVVHGLPLGRSTQTFSFHLHKPISTQNPSWEEAPKGHCTFFLARGVGAWCQVGCQSWRQPRKDANDSRSEGGKSEGESDTQTSRTLMRGGTRAKPEGLDEIIHLSIYLSTHPPTCPSFIFTY